MKTVVWMSYDLGVKGDYQGLYAWLDDHNAIECGNSVAFFHYEYKKDFLSELKKDLNKNIEFDIRDRIYIVRTDSDKKTRGIFLIGKRKSNPWIGYGAKDDNLTKTDE